MVYSRYKMRKQARFTLVKDKQDILTTWEEKTGQQCELTNKDGVRDKLTACLTETICNVCE